MKPLEYPLFEEKFNKLLEKAKQKKQSDLVIWCNKEMEVLDSKDITYIEVIHHTLIVHTLSKDYKTTSSLKDIEKKLPSSSFIRCNSCYLVNLKYVTSLKDYTVNVGKTSLQISRPKKKDFLSALNRYLGEI